MFFLLVCSVCRRLSTMGRISTTRWRTRSGARRTRRPYLTGWRTIVVCGRGCTMSRFRCTWRHIMTRAPAAHPPRSPSATLERLVRWPVALSITCCVLNNLLNIMLSENNILISHSLCRKNLPSSLYFAIPPSLGFNIQAFTWLVCHRFHI